jgi:hypothetical protein
MKFQLLAERVNQFKVSPHRKASVVKSNTNLSAASIDAVLANNRMSETK